jgi:hypothetical protein
MGQLTDHFDSAAAQLCDDLADTVGYSPDGVEQVVAVAAIIGQEEVRTTQEQDGIKVKHLRPLSIPRTTAAAGGSNCLPNVAMLGQFTVFGLVYSVEAITSQTASWTRLDVYRLVTREKTRQNYRRSR